MSKRILILTGSPRRGGNSNLMADAFAKGASEAGNSVVQFNTAHKHIGIVRSFELIAQDRGWKNRGHYLVNSVNEKGAISNTEHLQKIYDIGKKF